MSDLNDLTQNVNIWNDEKSKSVTVTTDGSHERLDVDANVTGGITIEKFEPKFDYGTPNYVLTNGVDYTFKTVTGTGKVDFFQTVCKNASYEIILLIDGTEQLRISMGDLGTIGLLSSNSTTIPVYAASASKIFAMHPHDPFDFASSFTIKVKATAAGNELDGWWVSYREII